METPYERLRQARIQAGFKSAAEAARQFGWNEAAYRHHENGTRSYSTDQATKYGEAFQAPWYWLLDLSIGKTDTYRIALGKFYTEAWYSRISWIPGAEEAVQDAREKLGLQFVIELDVSLSNIDPVQDDAGFPQFHLINPSAVGVAADRFLSGYLFMMRAPTSLAKSAVRRGDLMLVDSEFGEIKEKPELWVVRSFEDIYVCWAKRGETGATIALPDDSHTPAMPLDPKANVVGTVLWVGHTI